MIRLIFKASIRSSIIAVVFFLSQPATSFGQIHFPKPSEYPYWVETHSWMEMPYYVTNQIVIYYKTDTVIGGQTYNRLYRNGDWNSILTGPPYSYYHGDLAEKLYATIRQDTADKKVFILDNTTEVLLYDFKNLEPGNLYPETYNTFYEDSLFVVSLDSVLLNNSKHHIWNLAFKHNGIWKDSGFVSIIEGIGSTFGLIAHFRPPFENADYLNCFHSYSTGTFPDTMSICDRTFGMEDYFRKNKVHVYPNPAAQYFTIQVENISKSTEVMIFDLSGRVLIFGSLTNQITGFDISQLDVGMYIMVLKSEGQLIEMHKLIIRR